MLGVEKPSHGPYEDSAERGAARQRREKTQLLAIAHYNLGSQEEFLRDYKACVANYERAIEILEGSSTGENSALVQEFRQSLRSALGKYAHVVTWRTESRTFSNLPTEYVKKRSAQSANAQQQ